MEISRYATRVDLKTNKVVIMAKFEEQDENGKEIEKELKPLNQVMEELCKIVPIGTPFKVEIHGVIRETK